MTERRYIDEDGHAWPITGQWCRVCGLPMTPITPDDDTHPLCDGGEAVTR